MSNIRITSILTDSISNLFLSCPMVYIQHVKGWRLYCDGQFCFYIQVISSLMVWVWFLTCTVKNICPFRIFMHWFWLDCIGLRNKVTSECGSVTTWEKWQLNSRWQCYIKKGRECQSANTFKSVIKCSTD